MTYTKYSASGNDFVIFHTFIEKDYSELAIKLCNRTEGIGSDGLIALVPNSDHDFKWLFYNSDGSDAAMCGNGARACAHYAYSNNLAPADMKFLTDGKQNNTEMLPINDPQVSCVVRMIFGENCRCFCVLCLVWIRINGAYLSNS